MTGSLNMLGYGVATKPRGGVVHTLALAEALAIIGIALAFAIS